MNDFQQEFETAMASMYPDVYVTGVITRQQVASVMDAIGTKTWPKWIVQNKVGRALFAVGAPKQSNVTPIVREQTVKPQPVYTIPSVQSGVDISSLILPKDKNYVAFGNHRDLDQVVRDGSFFPVFVTGPTGNGKSTMIEQVHSSAKKPLIRINFNALTDEEQLIGSKTLVDGNVEIVEGPVLVAMRNGIPILCDEIDAGSANALLCLQGILEGKPYYFKLKNEIIYPKPGFNIYATGNTKGKGSEDGQYIGTNILNEAFLERFAITFEQEYPSATHERKIVMNIMNDLGCVNEQFADDLVKWADSIRRTYECGGVDSLITTRRMVHIIKAYRIYKDTRKAIEVCCNRFDTITQEAFKDLFDKISAGEDVQAQPASAEGVVVDETADQA